MRPEAAGRIGRLRRALGGAFGGRGRLVGVVAAGWFAVLGMRFVLPALLPAVRGAFGVDNAAAGAVVSVVWLTYALVQLPAGALTDRTGERRLLVGSLLAAAAGTAGLALAPGLAAFVVACAVFGVGTGVFGPPRATLVSRACPDHDGAAFGAILAAGSVGAALMPAAATVIATRHGWRVAFAAGVPLYLALALVLRRAVPRTERPGEGTDLAGSAARALAEVRRPPVLIATLAVTLMLFVFQGLSAFLPTYLVEVKRLAPPTAGLLFALVFLAGAACRTVAGRLADAVGHVRVLVGLAAVSALPLAALPFVDGLAGLTALSLAVGLRLGADPVSSAYVLGVLGDEARGTAWGVVRTGLFVASSAGSLVVGLLADRGLFDAAFLGLAGLTLVAAALYARLPARDR